MNRFKSLAIAAAMAAGLAVAAPVAAPPAQAQAVVDVSVFYQRLAPYGVWVEHARFGYVWYPTGVEPGWRPYTRGRWVWTEEHGWYWESDYEWGWATFHYGRWFYDDTYGWIWIPGTVWGPAWVAWREGDDAIGWAPLPPGVDWRDGSLYWGGIDMAAGIYLFYWSFVPHRYFLYRHPYRHFVRIDDRRRYMARTRSHTNYRAVNRRVVNHGLAVPRVRAFTREPVTTYRLRQVDRFGGPRVGPGNTINVYRPLVRTAPNARPPLRTTRPPSPTRRRTTTGPTGTPPPTGQPRIGTPPTGQPRFGQPPTGQPPTGQPRMGQPPTGQQRFGQPPTGQPRVTPRTTQPGTPPPGSYQPRTGQPRTVQPRTVQPRTVQPRTVQPRTVQPRTVQPRTTTPRTGQPPAGRGGRPAPTGKGGGDKDDRRGGPGR